MTSLEERVTLSFDSQTLHLLLFSTEQCNFRCTYCYEEFAYGNMLDSVKQGLKELVQRRAPELRNLFISWFGGEPLVNARTVLEFTDFCSLQARKYSRLKLKSDITTNGYYLTLELAKSLVSVGIQEFQITLDGDEDTHNKSRVLANGKHTFQVIWSNLIALHNSDLDFSIMLRIHYDRSNWERQVAFAKRLKSVFTEDRRFSFFFHDIVRLGGQNDNQINIVSRDEKHHIESELYEAVGSLATDRKELKANGDYICYASKPNSFVIRADGRIQKCTVALESDRNTIGHLNSDGTIVVNNDKLRPWIKGLFEGDKNYIACPNAAMLSRL